MIFKNWLNEIVTLDKTLKDITKISNNTWIFHINNVKFKVFIEDISVKVLNKYMKSKQISLQSWDKKKKLWTEKYFKSHIYAGVFGGKVVSIIYDIIKKHNPQILSMRAYDINLQRLYDLIWLMHGKRPPFDEYTKISKNIDGIKVYTFMRDMNLEEDRYMFSHYMEGCEEWDDEKKKEWRISVDKRAEEK